MAIYNLFVKLLDGKTLTLKLPSPTITGASLKSHLHTLTQIPPHHQRLLTGTHQIHDQTLLTLPHGSFLTVHLLLRLLGGKGGFGSLLRGAATKAGQKKTNNFDACRDMSGRRLRHVNAEKKLEEWKVEAEERRLEKVAEEFVKKRVKEGKKLGSGEEQKYIEKYREDSRKCREVVEAAVRESMGGGLDGKRKVLGSSGSAPKRLKLWMGKEKAGESDSDDEEDEDDESSVVLDDVNPIVRLKDGEGSSQSVLERPTSEGESSGGGSMQSNLEEENGNGNSESLQVGEGSGSGKEHTEADGLAELKMGTCEQIGCTTESADTKESVLDVDSGDSKETVDLIPDSSIPKVREGSEIRDKVDELNVSVPITASEIENPPSSEKPLEFNDYNSAEEMEVLGLETLKSELQTRGLKCGGTLRERAARLFLLKTTPLEKLPKKLLAKR